ncbi:MAG: multidrug efflux SMR transporter [Proteobacteria bacterium]|nr:multidrug efflux SMR transporter [Pseudomonadota bacterium]
MSWFYLILAILFEVTGTTAMKLSNGFQHPLPSVTVFVCYGASIGLLTLAVRHIDISVAYAIWSALGMTLITVIGIAWFKEPATLAKLVSIGVITLGVVGLNISVRMSG